MLVMFEACENIGILKTIMVILNIIKIICIIAPILLIIMLMIDFTKSVISGEAEETKKNFKTSIKRIIACMLIFFVPTIVAFIMNILGDMGVDYAKCITNANSEYIDMLETKNKSKYSNTNNIKSNTKSNNTKEKANTNKNAKKEETKNNEPFTLAKDLMIICHYHGNKVSKDKIIIYDKKGKKLSNKKFNFKLGKPIATISENGKVEALYAGKTKVTVSRKDNPKNKQKFTLVILKDIYTKGYLTKNVKTYDLKTGEKVTLPKGTTGTYNGGGFDLPPASNTDLYYHGDILKVGSSYYSVPYTSYQPTGYAVSKQYSKEIAEEFVNSYGFSSKTKHLFWVNQGTEYNYHFVYKRKKWVLKDVWEVNTGDVFGLNARYNGGNCNGSVSNDTYSSGLGDCDSFSDKNIDVRRLDGYWKGQWLVQKYVIFNHKDNGGGALGAWHEGFTSPREPKSHGCVRHRSAVMMWIRDHINEVAGSRIINF